MPDPLPFARWIKHLRAERDLTQEALAEAAGCAPQTIRAFESGARRPSRELTERLAGVLDVPAEQRAAFMQAARMPARDAPARPVEREQDHRRGEDTIARVETDTLGGWRDGVPEAVDARLTSLSAPILATKLYVPRLRAGRVARSRLVARLDASTGGLLTVIAAPAGFGKTTVLADWIHHKNGRSFNVAWVSLDAGDSDPIQFLRYLIAALQSIAPTIGDTTLALLRAPQPRSVETLLPLLINDLVRLPPKSVLVLDDYHVIDAPSVHQAITFLLDHLPPQLHLVLASRVDPPLPLARLRARGQLTELRAHDLRFTPEETGTFLREVMGVSLPTHEIAALGERTEGWVAGLQLAGLSLRDRPDEQRVEFIDAFTGSHRYVMDYLVDEVLARQPAHLQTFLLQTSILERLCGPLCDAVLLGTMSDGDPAAHHERGLAMTRVVARSPSADSYSQLMLEELDRSNLFIVPLDDERRWYRYHHLFAQVLRERLTQSVPGREDPEAVATLHRRAAAWLERQGLIVEAVQHALAARDWERAAQLIEAHGRAMIARGQVSTIRDWLNKLPETLVQSRPYLLDLLAVCFFCDNQLEAAEQTIQLAEAAISAHVPDDRSGAMLGYTSLLRANIARSRGDLARYIALSQKALENIPATDVARRSTAVLGIASAFLLSGDVGPANQRLVVDAVETARSADNLFTLFNSIVTLAELQRRRGRLMEAVATYDEATKLAPGRSGLQGIINGAAYYLGLGELLRERNDLDAAQPLLQKGQEMVRGRLLTHADALTRGYIALARLHQARGAGLEALAVLAELQEVAHQRQFVPYLLARAAAARAHLALLQGDLPSAVQWADSIAWDPHETPRHPHEPFYLTLIRVRIAQGRADSADPYLHDPLQLLDRLLADADAAHRVDSVIEILIVRALALHAQGDLPNAFVALQRALALAASEGYVRIFLDEGPPMAALFHQLNGRPAAITLQQDIERLLAAFGEELGTSSPNPSQDPRTRIQQGLELLTEREIEVLRLLAQGRSNQAIADELIVAVGTVKRHVNSILGKLEVQSRLEAVARARFLGLV